MAIRMLLLVYRKPGTTPEAFKRHYEEVHIPLMQKLSGDLFPITHTRRYITRTSPEDGESPLQQQMAGAPDALACDAISELVYRDTEHLQAGSALLQNRENAPIVAQDCEEFMDVARTAIWMLHEGDVVETRVW